MQGRQRQESIKRPGNFVSNYVSITHTVPETKWPFRDESTQRESANRFGARQASRRNGGGTRRNGDSQVLSMPIHDGPSQSQFTPNDAPQPHHSSAHLP